MFSITRTTGTRKSNRARFRGGFVENSREFRNTISNFTLKTNTMKRLKIKVKR